MEEGKYCKPINPCVESRAKKRERPAGRPVRLCSLTSVKRFDELKNGPTRMSLRHAVNFPFLVAVALQGTELRKHIFDGSGVFL
jgi:hypothetical protein